jgi:hypothetical protein
MHSDPSTTIVGTGVRLRISSTEQRDGPSSFVLGGGGGLGATDVICYRQDGKTYAVDSRKSERSALRLCNDAESSGCRG